MAFDTHKNFSYSTVATAPSPATSGTSLVLASGGGALMPTAPFNATIWPQATLPTSANSEIVRVTAIATDTLTITRTQEGTGARTVVVGDQFAATITAKTLTDIETQVGTVTLNVKNFGAKGDGTTDDTTAIQNAINALPNVSGGIKGGVVYFPAGTYRLTAALTAAVQNFCMMGDEGDLGQWYGVGSAGNSIIMAPPSLGAFKFNSGSASAIFAGPTLKNLSFMPPFGKLSGAQTIAATMNITSTASLASSGTAIIQDNNFVGVLTYTGKTGTTLTGCVVVSETTGGHSYANGVIISNPTPYGVKLSRTNNFEIIRCTFGSFADTGASVLLDDAVTTVTGASGLLIDGSVGLCQYGIVRSCRFYGCYRGAQENQTSTRWSLCDTDSNMNAATPWTGSFGWKGVNVDTVAFDHCNYHGCDTCISLDGGGGSHGQSIIGCRFETWATVAVAFINASRTVCIPNSMNNFQAGNIGTGVSYDSNSGKNYLAAHSIESTATRYSDAGTQNTIIDFDRMQQGGTIHVVGSGSPLNVLTANIGSTFRRTDGSTGTTFYVKESGNGTSAGWVGQIGPIYNVMSYGAVGNGTTDDTTAVQAALTACKTAGGGNVWLPSGTYKITSPLTFGSNVTLRGEGKNLSVLTASGSVSPVLQNEQISGVITRVKLADFSIVGNSATASAVGLQLAGVSLSLFENIRVSGFTGTSQVPVQLTSWLDGATYQHTIENVFINIETVGTNGFQLTVVGGDPTTSGNNNNKFVGARCSSYSNIGIDVDHGEGNTFVSPICSSPTNGTVGIRINDDVTTLLGPNTDSTAGGGNSCIGVKIESGVNDAVIINRGGNGPTTSILDNGTNSIIFRHPDTHIGGNMILGSGSTQLGFYGTASIAKPTVTGSKAGNVALASLLTKLASLGLLTDSST